MSAWDKPLEMAPEVAKKVKTLAEVKAEAETYAQTFADQQRTKRAGAIKDALLPFVQGKQDSGHRDKSGKMNLTEDTVPALQRRYSIATLDAFEKLMPKNSHMLRGHENDITGKPGFKGNTRGPYLNAVFDPSKTSTRPGINAHLKIGESQHHSNYVNAYSNYMVKNAPKETS
ncbi:hypothetical protein [Gynuella sunshinyii]|uniref:Uncharacterized protein n=1 Tax=Gynuella sunshinyii YC6258 TaxID=1445510 RepID=A0A0C5VDY4_9GAMM|nr:hypothetical protein [Gynuella sunshinyii]AJQ97530.1 hypothetical Protein YC6258_05502 [Gynuella sunshinyii YC6258]